MACASLYCYTPLQDKGLKIKQKKIEAIIIKT